MASAKQSSSKDFEGVLTGNDTISRVRARSLNKENIKENKKYGMTMHEYDCASGPG